MGGAPVRNFKLEISARTYVHQRCQFHLGRGQLLDDTPEQTDIFQKRFLILKGLPRRLEPLTGYLFRPLQRFTGFSQQGHHVLDQDLGADRAPVCIPYVLNDILNDLSTPLFHDQNTVRLLICPDVADTKVKHVPHDGDVGDVAIALLGCGCNKGLGAIDQGLTVGTEIIIPARITGCG